MRIKTFTWDPISQVSELEAQKFVIDTYMEYIDQYSKKKGVSKKEAEMAEVKGNIEKVISDFFECYPGKVVSYNSKGHTMDVFVTCIRHINDTMEINVTADF